MMIFESSKRTALTTFLQLVNPSYPSKSNKTTRKFKNLQPQSKWNFLLLTRTIINNVLEFLAGDDATEVRKLLFPSEEDQSNIILDPKLMAVMTGFAEAYNNAESTFTRRVAPQVDFKLLSSFIPGITHYRYTDTRTHAPEFGMGALVKRSPRTVGRFFPAQIAHFIEFIISSHICVDMPFGEKVLKLSNGTELHVPNTIRSLIPTKIIEQYYLYCHQMCFGFEPLDSSSLYKILEICKASTRKAFQGINNFVADGINGFLGLTKLVDTLPINSNEKRRFTNGLKRAKLYLKSDFKVHVSRSSCVADHCVGFALSDSKTLCFQSECDHQHDEQCIECVMMRSVLFDIKEAIRSNTSKDMIDRVIYGFDEYVDAILVWKAHLVRCVNQDLYRTKTMHNLSPKTVPLNVDWAMK